MYNKNGQTLWTTQSFFSAIAFLFLKAIRAAALWCFSGLPFSPATLGNNLAVHVADHGDEGKPDRLSTSVI